MPKMDYEGWNELISQNFFNSEMAGREVLLYVTSDIINQLGSETGENVDDFIKCIKEGPPWTSRQGICQKALQCYDEWKDTKQGYPQYLAYLAFFVLVATESEIEGKNFDQHAYYPKLRLLLGEPIKTGAYPSFDKMDKLWDSLEKWTRNYKHKELGRFTKRIRGGNVHIGLPLSQTILSEDEQRFLHQIFIEAEIDPTDPPSETTLGSLLLRHGMGKLRKRTLALLKDKKMENDEMRSALINFVIEEISEWDGSVVENGQISDRIPVAYRSRVGLRLCFDSVTPLTKKISFSLRFKTNQPFPDGGFQFDYNEEIYSCIETAPRWGTKLKNIKTLELFDAAQLDWKKSTKMEDKDKDWRAIFKGSSVRLFLRGSNEGLSGWIESQHLDRNCSFMIVCNDAMEEIVLTWGINCCKEFKKILLEGLPKSWVLFEGIDAIESCQNIDVLNLPSSLRLRLQGGIRIGRSNSYLRFKPPRFVLEGGCGNEHIIITFGSYKRELELDEPFSPMRSIPLDSPVGVPLDIEVYREGNEPLEHRVIQLIEPMISDKLEESPRRNCYGQIISGESSEFYARGAVVKGDDISQRDNFPQVLPTYLSRRIVFLGRLPGEIADWPDEDLPEGWEPVWALAKKAKSGSERWEVHFCGSEGKLGANYEPGKQNPNSRAVKQWSKAIWLKRKRIKEPDIKALRVLWAKYKEVAARNA
ncbi:MAG: hypothetical protein WCW68_00440 [Methanothrix sp.]